MMNRSLSLLNGLLILAPLTGSEPAMAEMEAKSLPGYVDLDSAGFQEAASVDLSVDAAQLALLGEEASGHSPEVAAIVSGLQAFRLRQYMGPDAQTEASAVALMQFLGEADWEQVSAEVLGDRQVCIYVKSHDSAIAGLTVIAIETGVEVSIANVVGSISPAHLGSLGLPIPQ